MTESVQPSEFIDTPIPPSGKTRSKTTGNVTSMPSRAPFPTGAESGLLDARDVKNLSQYLGLPEYMIEDLPVDELNEMVVEENADRAEHFEGKQRPRPTPISKPTQTLGLEKETAAFNNKQEDFLNKQRAEAAMRSPIGQGDKGHVIEAASPLFQGKPVDTSPEQSSVFDSLLKTETPPKPRSRRPSQSP